MTNPEMSFSPEGGEIQELRETLLEVARDFLMDGEVDIDFSKLSNSELGEYVQRKFQENLESFYITSGLAEKIKTCLTDDDVLHLIANKGEGVHGWVDMLPNLVKSNSGAGMNCTMSSAMLHIGLEKMGLSNVRTVTVKGHHVVLRELEDGSLKLYDASSKATVDGKLVGYSKIFGSEQISNRAEVEERAGRKGFQFVLDRGQQDDWGGFHSPDDVGMFTKKFYAYDVSIKMDVSIAIGNLSQIKDDAKELGGVKDLPLIDRDDYLRDAADFIRRNNREGLTDDDLKQIGAENPGAVNALMQQAERAAQNGEIPNPFDFIRSNLIVPKDDVGLLPDPKAYIGEARMRHEQAKELVRQHPFLDRLEGDVVTETFNLFSADQYVQ